MVSYIIRDRNVFGTEIKVFGEMNGKTKTQAEGRQQEEARPLEGTTQNQLIIWPHGYMVSRSEALPA